MGDGVLHRQPPHYAGIDTLQYVALAKFTPKALGQFPLMRQNPLLAAHGKIAGRNLLRRPITFGQPLCRGTQFSGAGISQRIDLTIIERTPILHLANDRCHAIMPGNYSDKRCPLIRRHICQILGLGIASAAQHRAAECAKRHIHPNMHSIIMLSPALRGHNAVARSQPFLARFRVTAWLKICKGAPADPWLMPLVFRPRQLVKGICPS